MTHKYICNDLNCAVYVFGESSGGTCPECYNPGLRIPEEDAQRFMAWYREALVHGIELKYEDKEAVGG